MLFRCNQNILIEQFSHNNISLPINRYHWLLSVSQQAIYFQNSNFLILVNEKHSLTHVILDHLPNEIAAISADFHYCN